MTIFMYYKEQNMTTTNCTRRSFPQVDIVSLGAVMLFIASSSSSSIIIRAAFIENFLFTQALL